MAKGKSKKKLSKKQTKALAKKAVLEVPKETSPVVKIPISKKEKPIIEIGETILVRDFASMLSLPVTEVIKVLMKNGVLATINESIDWETAAIAADELGFEAKLKEVPQISEPIRIEAEKKSEKEKPVSRPPVVTVMGHVDHGKTKLLDAIRQTDVISTEAGGITQHIGAYQITHKGKKITFVDTPGHQAFETMRAHGANITDIVILVVAADEGVKPQTIEAFKHAKKAGVPIIIAINKIDLPNANIQKVKQQLSELGLVCEDMGGKTICVPISAKQNLHIDDLLEMILLLSEMKNYQANPKKLASALVVESHLDPKLGPVASLLIQDGTLREGDFVVIGETWGKIRLIEDEHKKRLKKASPSQPVRIAGIRQLPSFGQVLQVVPDEKTAQIVLTDFKKRKGLKERVVSASPEKDFHIVLKADVFGSLEAILDNIKKIETDEAKVDIVREGVGNISVDDVSMAKTNKAKILAFKVGIYPEAKALLEKEKVAISQYEVIYDLIDELKEILSSLTKAEEEVKIGRAKVLKIFRSTKEEKIIGIRVSEGIIEKPATIKIKRADEDAGEGRILSLQSEKQDVEKIEKGSLGGLRIATDSELQEGDVLEFYKKGII